MQHLNERWGVFAHLSEGLAASRPGVLRKPCRLRCSRAAALPTQGIKGAAGPCPTELVLARCLG